VDVIRGAARPRFWRRWWKPRPVIQLVRGSQPPVVPEPHEDRYILVMVGAFSLFVLVFARFIGAWTGE